MPRLIDANRTCRVIEQLFCGNCNDYFRCENCSCNDVLKLLRNQQTVDVETVKHGHWDDTKVAFYLKCSECGCCVREFVGEVFLDYLQEWNYCPNCGAKMDEPKRGQRVDKSLDGITEKQG